MPEASPHRDPAPAGRLPTVSGAAVALGRQLRAAGIETPERDARLLAATAAGLDPAQLISHGEQVLSPEAFEHVSDFARRRLAREPVSRILGTRAFYGRDFSITPATLDPRADSETLIEAALGLVREQMADRASLRILDVGTGTGCLLATLLCELPSAHGTGTDISEAALSVARCNAEALGVGRRATFACTSGLAALAGPFDLLVSNPPYIPSSDVAGLAQEVRGFDPLAALDGGPDGLDMYRLMAGDLKRVVPRGWAVFEVGSGQSDRVAAILADALNGDAQDCRTWRDLEGHTRCVAASTNG